MSGRTPDEGRYSKVTRRMWNDERFRGLSSAPPNAQTLWLRLLSGPELGPVPGLFGARLGGLAEALGWPLAALKRCWREIDTSGMAQADWDVGLVWVPKAVIHNEPSSPNTVASWRKHANELPECSLRAEAFESISAHMETLGPPWIAAWQLAAGADWRPAKIKPDVRHAVRERDRDICRYCAQGVDWSDRRGPRGATYDHVDPTGPATLENLVVACRSCNAKKGFRTASQAGMKPTQVCAVGDLGNDLDQNLKPSGNQDSDSKTQEQDSGDPPDWGGGPDPNERSAVHAPVPPRGPLPLQAKAELYVRDRFRAVTEYGMPETWPEVIAATKVFHGVFQASPASLRPRDTRATLIVERFAQGYSVADLTDAARGARLDEHIAGRPQYQVIGTVWRDEGQIDRFTALLLAGGATPKAGGRPAFRPPDAGASGWTSTLGDDEEAPHAASR